MATVYEQVRESGEKVASKTDSVYRFPEAAAPGDYWRQGDLYITLLANVPEGAMKVGATVRLVPGPDTHGSRHCLDGLAGVTMWKLSSPGELGGPVVEIGQEERTVTHPEHAWVTLPAGRVFGISYQRAFADELRRRED